MKSLLEELKSEYQQKFTALLKVAEMFEKEDNDVFVKCLKKAAGCKLMLTEYNRQLSILNEETVSEAEERSERN
jgi:c-di-GMP-related signal transduction protein